MNGSLPKIFGKEMVDMYMDNCSGVNMKRWSGDRFERGKRWNGN